MTTRNCREAERSLGRMILAARENGDLAKSGQYDDQGDVGTLDTFNIGRDLAAHAVLLAGVPDRVWASWQKANADTEIVRFA